MLELQIKLRRLLVWLGLLQPEEIHYIGGSDTLPPPLTKEREAELLARLDDEDARKELIEHNLRLVVYIARRFENTGINIEDLISIGTIGLIKAVGTYRADKNIKLATYASRCIENEILMYLRKNASRRGEVSFDEPLNTDWDGNELLLSDVLGTEADVVMRPIEEDVDRSLLAAAINILSPREKQIITLRFGLEGGREQTQKEFADQLEGKEDFDAALHGLIRKTLKEHKRIIFNGNGYDDSWIKEAVEKRGLLNLRTTPDCMPCLFAEKNKKRLTGLKVYSPAELESRYEILMENYCKAVTIEAHTMVDMAEKEIIPAIEAYIEVLGSTAASKKAVDGDLCCCYEKKRISKLSALVDQIDAAVDALDASLITLGMTADISAQAELIRDEVLPKMSLLRAPADEAETLTAKKYWPFPTYGDLLFGV